MVQHDPIEQRIGLNYDERHLAFSGYMGSAALMSGREYFLNLHLEFAADHHTKHAVTSAQENVTLWVPDSLATSLEEAFTAYKADRCARILDAEPPLDPSSLMLLNAQNEAALADAAIQTLHRITENTLSQS